MTTDILFEISDCKEIKCDKLRKRGICIKKGKLPKFFECPILEITEARHEAGLQR